MPLEENRKRAAELTATMARQQDEANAIYASYQKMRRQLAEDAGHLAALETLSNIAAIFEWNNAGTRPCVHR